jgi:hypothetical protein
MKTTSRQRVLWRLLPQLLQLTRHRHHRHQEVEDLPLPEAACHHGSEIAHRVELRNSPRVMP